MSWLWESYEEFRKYIHPEAINGQGHYDTCKWESWFEHHYHISESADVLADSARELRHLGFGDNPVTEDSSQLSKARELTAHIAFEGERLCLYHRRLALSRWSKDFLHYKGIEEHWERYAQSRRIFVEIQLLLRATDKLLEGFHDFIVEDRKFLLDGSTLPSELESDFLLSRNLFSVGFDDAGLLISGRGLEGVLRAVAKKRSIILLRNGKPTPAHETEFFDLIEIFSRLRFQKDRKPLLTKDQAALMHYLRTLRNSGAHPASHGMERASETARDSARIVAKLAFAIWKSATQPRIRLVTKEITLGSPKLDQVKQDTVPGTVPRIT